MVGVGVGTNFSRVIGGGSAPSLDFLLRDDFISSESSPLTSPRICEPGPGTLVFRQLDGAFSIANGALVYPNQVSPSGGDLQLAGNSFNRVIGLALFLRTTRTTLGLGSFGWSSSTIAGSSSVFQPFILDLGNGTSRYYTGLAYSEPSDIFISGSPREYVIILRSPGSLLFSRTVGGTWVLGWVENISTDTTLYPALENRSALGTLDSIRVANLMGGFNSTYGISTDSIIGAVSQGTTFAHEANCLIENQVTRPSSGANSFSFRKQDSDNYWRLRCTSAGTLFLDEFIGGALNVRGTSASAVATGGGSRVVIICSGTNIKIYSGGILSIEYASASNFQNETEGEIISTGNGGNFSNLITWPRTMSGQALNQLNLLAA